MLDSSKLVPKRVCLVSIFAFSSGQGPQAAGKAHLEGPLLVLPVSRTGPRTSAWGFPPVPMVFRVSVQHPRTEAGRRKAKETPNGHPSLTHRRAMRQAVVVLLLVLATGSHQQCFSSENSTALSSAKEDVFKTLAPGEKVLSVVMLKALAASSPGNVVFSPLSLHQVLLLAYFGSGNGTEKLLKYFLRIPPEQGKPTTLAAYRSSNNLFNKADAYTLKTANRIYVSDKLKVRPCMSENFVGQIEKIDLASNIVAAQEKINSWVENRTEGQIKNFLSQLSPASKMVLVNAAFFNGTWEYSFPKNSTYRADFFVTPKKKVKVDMMKQLGPFNYMFSLHLEAHVLELPYKGEEVSMFLILPRDHKEKDVDEVIKKMDANVMDEITKTFPPDSDIGLHLPKFTVENKINMEESLKMVGAGDLFDASADFSGFTGKNEVSFNGLKHQARMEVNEEGTKAAAASAAGVFLSAGHTPSFFICNRPFVYFIYHKKSGNVLFMGIYRLPEKSV